MWIWDQTKQFFQNDFRTALTLSVSYLTGIPRGAGLAQLPDVVGTLLGTDDVNPTVNGS